MEYMRQNMSDFAKFIVRRLGLPDQSSVEQLSKSGKPACEVTEGRSADISQTLDYIQQAQRSELIKALRELDVVVSPEQDPMMVARDFLLNNDLSTVLNHFVSSLPNPPVVTTTGKHGEQAMLLQPDPRVCEQWITKLHRGCHLRNLSKVGFRHPVPGLLPSGSSCIDLWMKQPTERALKMLEKVSLRTGVPMQLKDESVVVYDSVETSAQKPVDHDVGGIVNCGKAGSSSSSTSTTTLTPSQTACTACTSGPAINTKKASGSQQQVEDESGFSTIPDSSSPQTAQTARTFEVNKSHALFDIKFNDEVAGSVYVDTSFHCIDIAAGEMVPLPYEVFGHKYGVVNSVCGWHSDGQVIRLHALHHAQWAVVRDSRQRMAMFDNYIYGHDNYAMVATQSMAEKGDEDSADVGVGADLRPATKAAVVLANKVQYQHLASPTKPPVPWMLVTKTNKPTYDGHHLRASLEPPAHPVGSRPMRVMRMDSVLGLGRDEKSQTSIDLYKCTQADLVEVRNGRPKTGAVLLWRIESLDPFNTSVSETRTLYDVELGYERPKVTKSRRMDEMEPTPGIVQALKIKAKVFEGLTKQLVLDASDAASSLRVTAEAKQLKRALSSSNPRTRPAQVQVSPTLADLCSDKTCAYSYLRARTYNKAFRVIEVGENGSKIVDIDPKGVLNPCR